MLEVFNKIGDGVASTVKEHSPEICLGLGIACTLAGTVVACKGTIKARKVVDEAREDIETIEKSEEEGSTYDDANVPVPYSHKDAVNDKAIILSKAGLGLVKAYGPAVILTATGIALLISGHKILRKRNIALVAAYQSISEAYKRYQSKAADKLGETVARNLKYNLEEKEVETETGKKNKDGTPKTKTEKLLVMGNPIDEMSPYCRIYDDGCTGWDNNAAYNLAYLKGRQSWWNDVLKARPNHTVFLNEVYKDLGIPETEAGQVVGWTLKPGVMKDGYIDFGIFNMAYTPNRDFVNGYQPVCLLDFNVDGVVIGCLEDK